MHIKQGSDHMHMPDCPYWEAKRQGTRPMGMGMCWSSGRILASGNASLVSLNNATWFYMRP